MPTITLDKTRQFARSLGITVVNIPAFLLACKMAALTRPEQMAQIIDDLKTRDFYELRPEIRHVLLE
jgi:predicted nucleic acid-binding protein